MIKQGLVLVAVGLMVMLALTACAGGTTPAGPLGKPIDLRPLLPTDVRPRAPTDTAYGKFDTAKTTIRVGNPAATVEVSWNYFKDGQRSYLSSVAFRVIESAEGLTLSATTNNTPVYVGSNDRAIEALRVGISWSRQAAISGGTFDTVNGLIVADGTWQGQ